MPNLVATCRSGFPRKHAGELNSMFLKLKKTVRCMAFGAALKIMKNLILLESAQIFYTL